MNHRGLADAAEHAVPNQLSEHGLKVMAVLQANQRLSAAELFKWCATQLPYCAIPRSIEFR
jgi:hypothetical protein